MTFTPNSAPHDPTDPLHGRPVRFSAVGDITLGDHPLCVGFGAFSRFRREAPLFPFENVLTELRSADVLFGNLECSLSLLGLRPNHLGSIQMRGDPRHIDALAEAGFDVLNLANNHCMQHGHQAFLDTAEGLRSRGIGTCGISRGDHLTTGPVIVEAGTVKIGILGYSLRPRQYFSDPPLYAEGHLEGMRRQIAACQLSADVVIVSLHWGEEFIDRPSPGDIQLARQLIDSGADLIIGHHPHVLRGIEQCKRGWIVYSLGNFVCDMSWAPSLRETGVFSCAITKSAIGDCKLMPLIINEDYQPSPPADSVGEAILSRVNSLSERLSSEDLTDFAGKSAAYDRAASEILQVYRKTSHRHFLRNLHRYPAPVLLQQTGSYLHRSLRRLSRALFHRVQILSHHVF